MQGSSRASGLSSREWEGFLQDEVCPLTPEDLRSFTGKRILITGAGGYLGSALARALGRLPIASLVLLDIAEYGLYRLEQDLRTAGHPPSVALVVGSICDRSLLNEVFVKYAPEIVFHAAALKHVPLMEDNALAAAETNALGTLAVVDCARRFGIESLVFLSTDKAVEPISVMGATKRIAEQVVLSAAQTSMALRAIRLCNVLGSTGSVAPLFARQLTRGGPVTVTHPEATRYFLSRRSAVRHLLRCAVGKRPAGLSVPVLGEPHRIEDLAQHMLKRASSQQAAIRIVHTGLRPSDKLSEQLVSPFETSFTIPGDPSALAIRSPFSAVELESALTDLQAAIAARDRVGLFQAIGRVVPGYRGPRLPGSQVLKEDA